MKRFIPITALLFLFACNNSETKEPEVLEKPQEWQAAAQQFIRAALDGDYTKARTFLIKDSTNKQTIDTYEIYYKNNRPPDQKKALQAASVYFLKETHQVNDSVAIVHYSNSYSNTPDSLKVVKLNGQWLIDMNFTFQPKDSIPPK
jgi:hypothetical protein